MRVFDQAALLGARLLGHRSVHVQTASGTMHTLEAKGRGQGTIVVLHGLAAAAVHYTNLIEALRPYAARVIGIDLPGHGFSEVSSDLERTQIETALARTFIERVGSGGAIVVGNSLGGVAAVRLAGAVPGLTRGLFLIAPGGASMTEDELRFFLRRFSLKNHADSLAFVDDLFESKHRFRSALAWGTRQKFEHHQVKQLVRNVRVEHLLTGAEVRALEMPVHVLWGSADRILPAAHLGFWRANLPAHGTLEVAQGFGHVPHIDRLDPLTLRIRHFVQAVPLLPRAPKEPPILANP